MTPRARRRRFRRDSLRLLVSLALVLSSLPARMIQAAAPERAPIDPNHSVRSANNCTVKIKAQARASRTYSSGAGVVVSADGYILTAHHVVRDFPIIRVTTAQGEILNADLVLVESSLDIAMVKVAPRVPMEYATFGSPESLTPGRQTLVIGNPLGMGQALVRGTLGDSRMVNWDGHHATLAIINADIYKGNSGGGTFDLLTGEFLGINVAKSSLQENTGYMVPVDKLVAIINRKLPLIELIDSEEIYNELGVRLRSVTLLDSKRTRGMLITSVKAGSVAAASGWEVGDVLLGLDKYQMIDQDAVLYVLRDTKRDNNHVYYRMARGDDNDDGYVTLGQAPSAVAGVAANATTVAAPRTHRDLIAVGR